MYVEVYLGVVFLSYNIGRVNENVLDGNTCDTSYN